MESKQLRQIIAAVLLFTLVWYGYFYEGINSAINVWLSSEIFNHCLFVLPASYYLIYRQRDRIQLDRISPNYWLAIPLAGCLILYAFGAAGDIQLFMHVAAFTALPLLWWFCLGNSVTRTLAFPLFFILFSIPIGEEFIPFLQSITADMAVTLLNATGVPNFNSGLYIEIPQGRFLVAEACSGISFLIASIVIGLLFIHLNIHSPARKVGFLLMSIAFPIFANAIRVYGIIYIAYLTDMEYAAGADHLIYGWLFFAIVIIGLMLIGQLFVDNPTAEVKQQKRSGSQETTTFFKPLRFPLIIIVLVILPFNLWISLLHNPAASGTNTSPITAYAKQHPTQNQWIPSYHNATDSSSGRIEVNENIDIDYFIAWYPAGSGEMLNTINRFYHELDWNRIDKGKSIYTSKNGEKYVIESITNGPVIRWLAYQYIVDGKNFTDKRVAKLFETVNVMLNRHTENYVIAFSTKQQNAQSNITKEDFITEIITLQNSLIKEM